MKKLGDLMMILDLHRQGLKVAVIARQVGVDRKTVRKYIARGLEPPGYGPRQPRARTIDKHVAYLRSRLEEYPGLTAQRLLREIAGRGYAGGYSMVRDEVRALRPTGGGKGFAVRFETLPGEQAQVDFAQFRVGFTAEPGVVHIVWLFSIVLGYSRLIWGRFAHRQTMQTVLACHKAAFEAFGGVPRQILYDRMKTAVSGEDADGQVVYNRTLGELAHHYGFLPKACRPYRPETKGKVERPFRYIREDFFLGGVFRDLDDLNRQFKGWLGDVANPRLHATTGRVVTDKANTGASHCAGTRGLRPGLNPGFHRSPRQRRRALDAPIHRSPPPATRAASAARRWRRPLTPPPNRDPRTHCDGPLSPPSPQLTVAGTFSGRPDPVTRAVARTAP